MSELMIIAVFGWTLVEGDYAESLLLLVRWAYVYRKPILAWIDDVSLVFER